ncbi:MAG: polysaccharide export protein [Candidatus Hydrogenedentes bacterium]|nr:polysaccharide export protein [Candidatus Hydrogenedentota bacterium]
MRIKLVGILAALAMAAGCATSGGGSPDRAEGSVKQVKTMSAVSDKATVPTSELRGEQAPAPALGGTPEPGAAAAANAPNPDEYPIGPDDLLDFRSLDDPSLSSSVTVRYDGCISLPLVPDLVVKNATRSQAEDMIRKAYSKVFKDPQVSLTIRESRSKSFYVMGDVNKAAEFPYKRDTTLLDAINTAGGLRINQRSGDTFVGQQGQLTKALIIRHVGDERQITEYDLRNLSSPGPHASDTPVYPGDIVYVPEGVNLIYVIGEVRSPGVFQMTEGMKLLELIVRTGGPDFSTAKLKHVVLLREVDETHTEVLIVDLKHILSTGQDVPLKPGDVVYVPRKDLVRAQEFVGRFTGSLSPLMGLYNQAWSTYYTAAQFHRTFDNKVLGGVQGYIQQLQNANSIVSGLSGLGVLKP